MLIGKKVGMTQLFTDEGRCVPVTKVAILPATVLRKKSADADGYDSVVVGYGTQKEQRLNKARKGEVGEANYRAIREWRAATEDPERADAISKLEVDATMDANQFEVGDTITVSGTSKAKGFQGVVKRHNFAGAPKTHGQKHTLRAPGSIGATGPQRVFKGLKMAGRTGGDRVTVKNLSVAHIDQENNLLYVKGAVPGRRDTLIEVVKTPAKKKKQS
jgi:large subunit ribosomal protein L3